MGKYSEISSTTEVNASAPCSVEYQLQAKFPDDKGQTYSAKGIAYTAQTPQGAVDGVFDGNGEVVIPDVGIGNVTIEVLPDIDKEIIETRESIKKALDAVIVQERAEGEALEKSYDALDATDKVLVSTGAVMQGGWNIIKSMGEALESVAHEAGEYILDPLNAPETFKEDVQAVKAKYHALKSASSEALDAYHTLQEDEATWKILEQFASDYYDAQHHIELTEGGSEAVLGIILTIVTAGAGAAVAGTRLATLAAKVAPKIQKIIKAIKHKKWFKKKKTIKANKRHEVKKEIIREDFLKDSSVPKEVYRGDGRSHDKIFEDGFEPKAPGSDRSLEDYVNTGRDSNYVSTTTNKNIAEDFANDNNGHLYTIDTDGLNGIDVNKELGGHEFEFEDEIAFPGGIPSGNIKGVTPGNSNHSILNPNYRKGNK